MNLPAGHAMLGALLCIAAVIDWRTMRLPNWLTMGGTALGLAMSVLPQGPGLAESFLGVLAAIALLVPLWILRITGAGDVKLVAMVGAFVGIPDLLFVLPFVLVAGGLFAIGLAAFHRGLGRLVSNTRVLTHLALMAALQGERPSLAGTSSVGLLPYGVSVCAGTLAWLAWHHLRT
jgi:prepilin peptidase CpaA